MRPFHAHNAQYDLESYGPSNGRTSGRQGRQTKVAGAVNIYEDELAALDAEVGRESPFDPLDNIAPIGEDDAPKPNPEKYAAAPSSS